ncbi:MAG TPA: HAD-IA family hydrolase [Candidatus Koribacter sp.]|jgi:putative hydrolase of the HAD superfamily
MTGIRVSTVLFDADGVLQDPIERWQPAFARKFSSVGDNLDAVVQSVIATELTHLTRDGGFLDDLDATLARCKFAGRSAEVLEILNAIRVDSDIVKIVRELRARGINCHLATNQQSHRARYMSEAIGHRDLFDREFYSCRIGIAKPDIGFFKFILGELRVQPGSVLFIDDREDNVTSAIAAGLQARLFPAAGGATAMRNILNRFGL